MNKVTKLMK